MLKIPFICLMILTLSMFVSCSNELYLWDFVNDSSFTVIVTDIKNSDDGTVNIAPKTSTNVIIKSFGAIQFQYGPSNLVAGDIDMPRKTVTFTNK